MDKQDAKRNLFSHYLRKLAYSSAKSELDQLLNHPEDPQQGDHGERSVDPGGIGVPPSPVDVVEGCSGVVGSNDISVEVVDGISSEAAFTKVDSGSEAAFNVVDHAVSVLATENPAQICSEGEETDSACTSESGDDDDGGGGSGGGGEGESIRDFLQLWSCKYNIANNVLESLLGYLQPYHPSLPRSAKTLKDTHRSIPVKLLDNGQYAHLGLLKGLLIRLEKGVKENVKEILIYVFVDGVKVYQSVTAESWPIMARCVNCVDSKPFVIGIFYGVGKPHAINEYLEDYIKEVQDLTANGLTIKGNKYSVGIRFYLGDAPSRAYLKCIVGHTSKNGCERCDQSGDYLDMVIYSTSVGPERTDSSFDRRDSDHHKGDSPLMQLGTKFISQFVLDPMHLVEIGVFKRFLKFILSRGPPNTRLTGEGLKDFADLLDIFSVCTL